MICYVQENFGIIRNNMALDVCLNVVGSGGLFLYWQSYWNSRFSFAGIAPDAQSLIGLRMLPYWRQKDDEYAYLVDERFTWSKTELTRSNQCFGFNFKHSILSGGRQEAFLFMVGAQRTLRFHRFPQAIFCKEANACTLLAYHYHYLKEHRE